MKILIYKAGELNDLNFFWSVQYFVQRFGSLADISVVLTSDEFSESAEQIPLPYRPLLGLPCDSDLVIVVGQDIDLVGRFFELAKYSHERAYFYSISDNDEIHKSKARAFALGLKIELDNIRFNEQNEEERNSCLFMNVGQPPRVENIKGLLIYGEDIEGIFATVDNISMTLPEFRIGVLTNSKTFNQLESINNRADVYRYAEVDISYLTRRFQALVDLNDEGGGTQRATLIRMFADQGSMVYSNLNDLPDVKNIVHISGSVAGLVQPIAMQLSQTGRRFLPGAVDAVSDSDSALRSPPSIGNAAIDQIMEQNKQGQSKSVANGHANECGIAYLAINGNGLGHAQRVANIATLVDPAIRQKVFCFNSCVPFLTERGLDASPLVSRPIGKVDQNIELLNFGRMVEGSRGFDRFVFDGGYPYDSVVGLLQRFGGRKIWIRRGLWKALQDNSEPKARAKFFDLIVRPGEFFDELNKTDETFNKEVSVGPVVNLSYADERKTGAPASATSGKIRILSMLGSGFIKDRSDILQAICQYCDRRSDVEHVSVIWPQTKLAEAADAYRNTTFVSTNQGTRLILDSDIVITAAGYNTFGDCMYYQKPAIFLPQQADWLDDQYLRAESAHSRGLADLVKEGDILGLLKSIGKFCDSGVEDYKAAFKSIELPEPGNRRIAEIIME